MKIFKHMAQKPGKQKYSNHLYNCCGVHSNNLLSAGPDLTSTSAVAVFDL